MMRTVFNTELFACALDTKRFAMRMTWADVAKIVGVSKSTVSRVQWRKRCDVDSLAALLKWLDEPFEKFIMESPDDH